MGLSAIQLQCYLLLWGFGLSWHFELHLEKLCRDCECLKYSLLSWLWLVQVMPGLSGRAVSPEIQTHFTPAVIPTTVMVSFSFPTDITRVQLC